MGQISIQREFEFESAHQLTEYDGKCNRLHGHNYRLLVEISRPLIQKGSEKGMVMDFHKLDRIVEDVILSKLDHSFLNDVLPEYVYPTAEEILLWIVDQLFPIFWYMECSVVKACLYENDKSCAVWRMK